MNNKSPKVTVLVPSYNHAPYIKERIQSILDQTYNNFELIVIDDFSQDNSDQIISEMQTKFGFTYIRNQKNSGSPFSSWERICQLAKGDYIWVCESDDVAEPQFLETAIKQLSASPNTALFYCSSQVIDENGKSIGHTDTYFHETWKETRWDRDFGADGVDELIKFQLRGQTVPNMSSALFLKEAFQSAFTPFLKKLHLTGDWLFVGDVMKHGNVVFSHETLSRFRKHEITSRERVKSARSQAEFILTKYRLFKGSHSPASELSALMKTDFIRFLYEPARWYEVVWALLTVSTLDTLRFAIVLFFSIAKHPRYIKEFFKRYYRARSWSNNE